MIYDLFHVPGIQTVESWSTQYSKITSIRYKPEYKMQQHSQEYVSMNIKIIHHVNINISYWYQSISISVLVYYSTSSLFGGMSNMNFGAGGPKII